MAIRFRFKVLLQFEFDLASRFRRRMSLLNTTTLLRLSARSQPFAVHHETFRPPKFYMVLHEGQCLFQQPNLGILTISTLQIVDIESTACELAMR